MKKILIVLLLLITFALSGCGPNETELPSVGDEYTHCVYVEETWYSNDKVFCTDELGVRIKMSYWQYKRYLEEETE